MASGYYVGRCPKFVGLGCSDLFAESAVVRIHILLVCRDLIVRGESYCRIDLIRQALILGSKQGLLEHSSFWLNDNLMFTRCIIVRMPTYWFREFDKHHS